MHRLTLWFFQRNWHLIFYCLRQKNPKACPILEVTNAGDRYLSEIADHADIAKDIPQYCIYENGELTGRYMDVSSFWREDLVSFLIGVQLFL